METPKFEDLIDAKSQERYIKIHYPEFHEHLLQSYPKDLIWGERLYWYYNNINNYPVCPECGKRVGFKSSKRGYYLFCSNICKGKSNITIQKKHQTSLQRYGVENPMQSETVREKQRKTVIKRYGVDNVRKSEIGKASIRKTMRAKYGVDYPMQSETVREKSRNTLLEKYGVDHNSKQESNKQHKHELFQDPNFVYKVTESQKNTNLIRYGYEHTSQVPEIRKKFINSRRLHYIEDHDNILGYTEEGYWKVKCPHPDCTQCKEKWFVSNSGIMGNRIKTGREVCTRILPIAESQNKNTSIELFIQNILNKHNIKYRTNVRDVISPKELDIYIPNSHIGIECNGRFWHSTLNKESDYHIQKYNNCQEKGIKLLSIWEDWIVNSETRDIVESLICNNLNIYEQKIEGNYKIQELDTKTSNQFLQNNHIYGRCASKIKLGLFYEDELVSIMCFTQDKKPMSRKHQQYGGEYTVVRFCNKLNIQVQNAQTVLLHYFVEHYNPAKTIYITYNDLGEGLNLEEFSVTKQSSEVCTWFFESRSYKRHNQIIEDGIQIYDSGITKWNIIKS